MNFVLHSQPLLCFSGLDLERAVNTLRKSEERMTQLQLITLYVCDQHEAIHGQTSFDPADSCVICGRELEARPYVSLVELKDVFDQLRDWRDRAYPENLFPKPDLELARKLLKEGGMTLDSVGADAMRHALTSVCRMLGMEEKKDG